ncbi:TatD family hydrolase [Advenella sp. WQ 585]|uniref:TatD family hydrolase n=1 Tax=Advenella mandrilli TaxID=2800330 RepID=A0ABS1EFR8_9BURK|nr:TatD family hydrolase [Advenella mandrilli]MBK1781152.1 TatD family hydrolase [Advenella mandrilli]
MLIDTHCHLDAAEFDHDRDEVIADAHAQGVNIMVIPAVEQSNFATVKKLAHRIEGGFYALGIHPMYVHKAQDKDLGLLEQEIARSINDPRFVGVGEIGLDFFVTDIASGKPRERQEYFYSAQLSLAKQFNLPVILHVRKSQDTLLKYLRRFSLSGGIAHAFNGSFQQAQAFIDLGFALGLGGAMTYTRSLQIRRLASELDLSNLVLETDSPDIPPAWLHEPNRRNTPGQIFRIAQELAVLRQESLETISQSTANNAKRVLPRMILS